MDTTSKIVSDRALVSVVMLTYNRAHFLSDAIASVLAQTYQNFELIIIDDGSTDDTPRVMDSFSDPRIRFIRHEENAGLVKRRRESLAAAQGQYIAVLDSDDTWIDTQKLEAQVAYMETHPNCAVCGTFITLIDENGVAIGSNRYATTDRAIRSRILVRNQFAHSSVLLRKSLVQNTEGYRDFPIGEDLDLFLQLGQHGEFANLPAVTTAYRVHERKASGQKRAVAAAVLSIIQQYRTMYSNYFAARLKYWLMSLLG